MALTQISTAGVKDDAVTAGKIPADAVGSSEIAANAVGSSELADNAVDTAAIADQAVALSKLPHGDGSSDGKFLRANNGADPSFETVTPPAITTLNNATNNRILTSEGGTTVNSEANLTFNGGRLVAVQPDSDIGLLVQNSSHDSQLRIECAAANKNSVIMFADGDDGDVGMIDYDHNDNSLAIDVNAAERMRIDSSGKVFIGDTSNLDSNKVNIFGTKAYSSGIPQQQLIVADAQAYSTTDNGGAIGFSAKYNSGGSYTTMASIEGVKHNNIDGNYQGAIAFKTRNHNGDNVIRMRLTDNGLCFGTDTAAANALDDYEEGTWTPTVDHGTVSASGNLYTKIGRLVYLQAYLTNFSNNSNGNNVGVGGLPFTVANSGQAAGATMYAYINNDNRFIAYVDGSNKLFFYGVYSGNYSSLKHNDLGSNANMHIFATYITST